VRVSRLVERPGKRPDGETRTMAGGSGTLWAYIVGGLLLLVVGGVSAYLYVLDPTPDMGLNALNTFFTAALGIAATVASVVYRDQDNRQKESEDLQARTSMLNELAQGPYRTVFRTLHEICIVCDTSFSWSRVVLLNEHTARRVAEAVACLTSAEFHLYFAIYNELPEKEQCYFDITYPELGLARIFRGMAQRSEREWQHLASMFFDESAVAEGVGKWEAALNALSWPQIVEWLDDDCYRMIGYADKPEKASQGIESYGFFEPRFYANARSLFKYLRKRFGVSKGGTVSNDDLLRQPTAGEAPSEAVQWMAHFHSWILVDVPVRTRAEPTALQTFLKTGDSKMAGLSPKADSVPKARPPKKPRKPAPVAMSAAMPAFSRGRRNSYDSDDDAAYSRAMPVGRQERREEDPISKVTLAYMRMVRKKLAKHGIRWNGDSVETPADLHHSRDDLRQLSLVEAELREIF